MLVGLIGRPLGRCRCYRRRLASAGRRRVGGLLHRRPWLLTQGSGARGSGLLRLLVLVRVRLLPFQRLSQAVQLQGQLGNLDLRS
jgi:hypothetical protein